MAVGNLGTPCSESLLFLCLTLHLQLDSSCELTTESHDQCVKSLLSKYERFSALMLPVWQPRHV